MRQTVSLAFGKANLSSVLATYGSMKVTAPFVRVSAATSGQRVGQQTSSPVGTHDLNGVIVYQQVQHENGTVLLLTASWKRGGSPIKDAALFLRLRLGAPTYNILAKVPTGRENICGDSFSMFSGSADIMNADELLSLGIEVGRSYVSRFMDSEEIDECFSINQISAGSTPRPLITEITTSEGTQVKEIAQVPTRRLVLRRGG